MPRQSKGEVTAEQLREAKSQLARQALDLELEREKHAENLAAANLAAQIQALREEGKEQREGKLAVGRPSSYTEGEASALCEWISNGKSLRSWCSQTNVSPMTVYRWMSERADFQARYTRAHEDRADTLADEILDIADGVAGTESVAAVQAARLQVEARKWIASKLKPTKWGERQIIEQQGNVTFSLAVGRGQQTPPSLVIDAEPATIPKQINGLPPRLSDCESDSQT